MLTDVGTDLWCSVRERLGLDAELLRIESCGAEARPEVDDSHALSYALTTSC